MSTTTPSSIIESVPSLPEQAAQWHVLMQSDEATDAQRAAFEEWLSHKNNAEAYRRMDALWGDFDDVASPSAKAALKQELGELGKQRRIHRAATTLGSFILLMLTIVVSVEYSPFANVSPVYLLADHRTAVGEQKRLALEDGSQLILNTASAVNIDYSAQERIIHLVQGEIQIDVAKDASRPLVVMARQGSARALGTQFSVRDREQMTEVIVTESKVQACVHGAGHSESGLGNSVPSNCQNLREGESTRIHPDAIEQPQPINAAFENDWVGEQLIVDNQPLLDVLDELVRYHKGYWYIDRAGLKGYRVSGVFPLDDPERSLGVIARSLPVDINRYTALITTISAR